MSIFYAMLSKMKYINRWSLMRNIKEENLSEHSFEVSVITHCLGLIGNKRLGKNMDIEKMVMYSLYHDVSEIITGDMPTPIKYLNDEIRLAYKNVETIAINNLLAMLPDDFKKDYFDILFMSDIDDNEKSIIKAADRISALIKCIEEEKAGNIEFYDAKKSIEKSIVDMKLEEADIFMLEFLPSYKKGSIDDLTKNDWEGSLDEDRTDS